ISARSERMFPQARPIVDQYVEFVRSTLALPIPSRVKLASPAVIAGRNKKRSDAWNFEDFLREADKHGGPHLVEAHQNLLDLLTAMEDLQPRFDSTGEKQATYTVHSVKQDVGALAWIYADGQIYIYWKPFREAGQISAQDRMKKVWGPYLKNPNNASASATKEKLGGLVPEVVAELFQRSVEWETKSVGYGSAT